MKSHADNPIRHLYLVLGDQLNEDAVLFDHFDPAQDAIWMAETAEEASHVWCHKLRLVFFFSAMRHFRDAQLARGHRVLYHQLSADPAQDRGHDFAELLLADLRKYRPAGVKVVQPGDFRVAEMLKNAVTNFGSRLEILPDRHFFSNPETFAEFADGRKNWTMEFFYRGLRKKFNILMTPEGQPEGGAWNFDQDNRETFGKKGPPELPPPPVFPPDPITREVIDLVGRRFADHPGNLDHALLPVTPADAETLLQDFIRNRLSFFGRYEDAMWEGETQLYHSRLSAVMNLKLISPQRCVQAAVEAFQDGKAPLNSVEGFVRQILGWREFIRGVYFQKMPEYADLNALACEARDVPTFFWDGETDMACVKDSMRSVLDHAWNHHIPRLMVLGQFSMLLGVHPYKFHQWHMGMYADAIDWVSLPNTLGMSQFGDGGIVGSKPYCASGNYINKMSNYCKNCKYTFNRASGEKACPFTTLYWDFLDRHRQSFAQNHRMGFQMKNLKRKPSEEMDAIRKQARELREAASTGQRI